MAARIAAAVALDASEAARTPGSSSTRASIASSKICLEARPARSCGFATPEVDTDLITRPPPSSRPSPAGGRTRRRRFRGRRARLALLAFRSIARCVRVRAAEHAARSVPSSASVVHGLAEIVERGGRVIVAARKSTSS